MSKSVAENTLYLTLASIGQKVLAFVYFLYLALVMMPESTGAYFLALSLTTIFIVIANFGIEGVTVREVAKRPEQAKSLMRHAMGLKIPLLVLAIAAANIAAMLLGYDMQIRTLVLIASLVMVADAFSLFFFAILRGFQNLRYESLGIFIGQFITVSFGGAVLFLSPQLELLIVALILGSFFNAIYSAYHVFKQLGGSAFAPAWGKESRDLLRLAFPFGLAQVFVKVYSYIDTIFLSLFIGTTAVGLYAVAYKLTYAFQFIPLAFVAALYPGMSRLIKEGSPRLKEIFDDAMWYMAIIGTPIALGIWAIAPDLVVLAGGEYQNAAPILQILVLVLIPIFLDFPIGSLLNAADRQVTKTAIMGATMVINITLNAILIPKMGIAGAAYAALASFSFMLLAGLWFIPQIIKGYTFMPLIRLVTPILLSGIVMAAVTAWLRPILGYILVIPIGAIVYLILLIATKSLRASHVKDAMRLLKRTPAYETSSPDA